MRKTMRPPARFAQSQATNEQNMFPACIRAEGEGARRPTTCSPRRGEAAARESDAAADAFVFAAVESIYAVTASMPSWNAFRLPSMVFGGT